MVWYLKHIYIEKRATRKRMARKQCKTPKLEPVQCQKMLCILQQHFKYRNRFTPFFFVANAVAAAAASDDIAVVLYFLLPLFRCLSVTFHLFSSRAVEYTHARCTYTTRTHKMCIHTNNRLRFFAILRNPQ